MINLEEIFTDIKPKTIGEESCFLYCNNGKGEAIIDFGNMSIIKKFEHKDFIPICTIKYNKIKEPDHLQQVESNDHRIGIISKDDIESSRVVYITEKEAMMFNIVSSVGSDSYLTGKINIEKLGFIALGFTYMIEQNFNHNANSIYVSFEVFYYLYQQYKDVGKKPKELIINKHTDGNISFESGNYIIYIKKPVGTIDLLDCSNIFYETIRNVPYEAYTRKTLSAIRTITTEQKHLLKAFGDDQFYLKNSNKYSYYYNQNFHIFITN